MPEMLEIPYSEVGCKDCKWTPVGLGKKPVEEGLYGMLKIVRRHSSRNSHRGYIRMVRTLIFRPKEVADA